MPFSIVAWASRPRPSRKRKRARARRPRHELELMMNPLTDNRRHITRRALFGRTAAGIGTAALAYLLGNEVGSPVFGSPTTAPTTGPSPRIGGLPDLPHFAPKAKRVVYMFQNGAPSHVDLFDYKP